jgi:hypothetical protein
MIFVGRGFSHDVTPAESMRLQPLKYGLCSCDTDSEGLGKPEKEDERRRRPDEERVGAAQACFEEHLASFDIFPQALSR